MSVILIDDDPIVKTLVNERFSDDYVGLLFKVTSYNSLMAGQPMVHTMRPDITLLDLHLEVSPDETIRSIFSMSLDSAIVVLTKEDDDVLEARCFNAGAEDYVLKSHLKDRCFTRILKHAWQRHHATNRLRAKRALFELQKLNEEESSGSGK